MPRRRDYAAEYRRRDELARERGYRSYGQMRYQTQTKPSQFADLQKYDSWRRATRDRKPTKQVADWYRQGFLKPGESTDADKLARGSFLSWVVGTRRGRGEVKARIKARAKAMGNKTLGQIAQPDFNWPAWRADYERSKQAG